MINQNIMVPISRMYVVARASSICVYHFLASDCDFDVY